MPDPVSVPLDVAAIRKHMTDSHLTIRDVENAAGMRNGVLHHCLKKGRCNRTTKARLDKYFANGHAATMQRAASDEFVKSKIAKVADDVRTTRKQLVPSGFLIPAIQRLGISQGEVARLTGVSLPSITNYVKRGYCPLWFRAAVNGLMAEAAPVERERTSVSVKSGGAVLFRVPESFAQAAFSALGAIDGITITMTRE